VQACLRLHEDLHTLNPHLIVTGVTRTRDAAADSSYLSRKLEASGTTPATCRQTRLAHLVTSLDPKLAAAALGMNGGGLVRYLDDNIARTASTRERDARDPTRAQQVAPCTPWLEPCGLEKQDAAPTYSC